MAKIGFYSACTIIDMAPEKDMVFFFNCIQRFAVEKHPDLDWFVLMDRFYKRYLRREEMDPALSAIEKVQELFSETPTSSLVDSGMMPDLKETELDFNQSNLALIFNKYFLNFKKVIAEVDLFEKHFNTFEPVRILPSNMGAFIMESKRPLEEYDALSETDTPFWFRYFDGNGTTMRKKEAVILATNELICIMTASGNNHPVIDPKGLLCLMPQNASDEDLGKGILMALDESRELTVEEETALENDEEQHQFRLNKILAFGRYENERALYKNARKCYVVLQDYTIRFIPTRHIRDDLFQDTEQGGIDHILIPEYTVSSHIGAMLRLCLINCTD